MVKSGRRHVWRNTKAVRSSSRSRPRRWVRKKRHSSRNKKRYRRNLSKSKGHSERLLATGGIKKSGKSELFIVPGAILNSFPVLTSRFPVITSVATCSYNEVLSWSLLYL